MFESDILCRSIIFKLLLIAEHLDGANRFYPLGLSGAMGDGI